MKIYNSHFYEVARVRHSVPRFRFNGDGELSLWQQRAREKLTELLGLPLCQGETPSVVIDSTTIHEEFTEYRFDLETEPGYFVPCYLLIPNDGAEGHSLAICFGGHGSNMHITAGLPENDLNRAGGEKNVIENKRILADNPELNIAQFALRSGRAALVIESRAFGESGDDQPSCTENAKTAILMGRTLIGERIHDAIRVLDYVLDSFNINGDDVVATGYSGGGSLAFYLACLDERIAICAPCSSFCSYEKSIVDISHCLCNHIPGIRRDFEVGDLAGLIYPRALIIGAGESDPIFPFEGVLDSFELAKSLYFEGDEGKIQLLTSPDGHLYYGDLLWSKIADKKS